MGAVGSFFQGVGHAVCGMFGAGKAYDPIGDLRSQLSDASGKYNAVMQQNTMAMFADINASEFSLLKDINTRASENQKQAQYLHELDQEKIDQVSIVMQLIGALTIIIIFYLMALRNGNAKAFG